jgi:hypothetical protein
MLDDAAGSQSAPLGAERHHASFTHRRTVGRGPRGRLRVLAPARSPGAAGRASAGAAPITGRAAAWGRNGSGSGGNTAGAAAPGRTAAPAGTAQAAGDGPRAAGPATSRAAPRAPAALLRLARLSLPSRQPAPGVLLPSVLRFLLRSLLRALLSVPGPVCLANSLQRERRAHPREAGRDPGVRERLLRRDGRRFRWPVPAAASARGRT